MDEQTLTWINNKLRSQAEHNIRLKNHADVLKGHVFLRYVGNEPFSFGSLRLRRGDIVHFQELSGVVYDAKLETMGGVAEWVMFYRDITAAGFLDQSRFARLDTMAPANLNRDSNRDSAGDRTTVVGTSDCYEGTWAENNPNQFRWTFRLNPGGLHVQRNDGFATGHFRQRDGRWVGTLQWGNGDVWSGVVLYEPDLSCREIKTNQVWWFRR